jgi:GNAT superfamily N-acetyltransferase
MEIRIATKADVETVAELNRLLFREDAGSRDPFIDIEAASGEATSYFEEFISGESTTVFLAEKGKTTVGYLGGRYSALSRLRPMSTAELEGMYVRESFRGQQAGSLLIEAFFGWAKKKGAGRARVSAYFNNESARRLYERFGFTSKSVTLDMPL